MALADGSKGVITQNTFTIMNKEQFFSACEQARRGFLTALQWGLTLLIAPALMVVVFIICIEEIKD